jgi:hypothetical protein
MEASSQLHATADLTSENGSPTPTEHEKQSRAVHSGEKNWLAVPEIWTTISCFPSFSTVFPATLWLEIGTIGRLLAPVQLEIYFRLSKVAEDFLNNLLFKNLSGMILLHYLVTGGSVISSLTMCVW